MGVSVLLAAVVALALYVQRSEPLTSLRRAQVSHESASPEPKALPPWGMYRLVLHETQSVRTDGHGRGAT